MERFFCGAEVVCGEGALSALERWRGTRMLLVTSSGQQGREAAEKLRQGTDFREIRVFSAEYDACSVTPAAEGAEVLRGFDPDVVVALGDGETMACAKAMVLFGKKPCPLVAVPTVPGSGEEVSGWVTVTHRQKRHTLMHHAMQPAVVILDPALFQTCSRGRLAEEGFSLLADAVESYTARGGGKLTALLAREAFCGTWAALPAASMGRTEARERLQMASVMAGMAYDRAGLGLCHAMASALGSHYGISVGKLKGILLPEIIGCNAHAAGRKYAELARAAGLGGSTEQSGIRNLRSGVIRLRQELGLPEKLQQAGIAPERVWNDARSLSARILEDPVMKGNPAAVDDFILRRILETVTLRL